MLCVLLRSLILFVDVLLWIIQVYGPLRREQKSQLDSTLNNQRNDSFIIKKCVCVRGGGSAVTWHVSQENFPLTKQDTRAPSQTRPQTLLYRLQTPTRHQIANASCHSRGGWRGCRQSEEPFHIALTPHQIEVNTFDLQEDQHVRSGSVPRRRLVVTMETGPSLPPLPAAFQMVYEGRKTLKHKRRLCLLKWHLADWLECVPNNAEDQGSIF